MVKDLSTTLGVESDILLIPSRPSYCQRLGLQAHNLLVQHGTDDIARSKTLTQRGLESHRDGTGIVQRSFKISDMLVQLIQSTRESSQSLIGSLERSV
ncbi:hypothetical protein HG531_003629 [Fusarium graminearum]|nr:hypothetical protein HG531_003629 [Fusarium graminearum]